jgi:hypothetical protein
MTKQETTPSLRIGHLRTDGPVVWINDLQCIPVWREEEIAWFDVYLGYKYLGRKTLKECEEYK